MSPEIIIFIAAAIILLMLFAWSIKVLKLTVQAMLPIVVIFLLWQIGFGVGSQEIIQEILQIVGKIEQLILNN